MKTNNPLKNRKSQIIIFIMRKCCPACCTDIKEIVCGQSKRAISFS